MSGKICLSVLSVLTLFLMGSFVGLAICIRYSYYPEIWHYQQDSCEISDCQRVDYTCCYQCGSRFHRETCCRTCTYYLANTTLYLNDTIYDKIINHGTCNIPNMTCYYDDRDIYNTLSLNELSPPTGAVVGIALLSTFIFVLLVVILILAPCTYCAIKYEMEAKEKKKEENDDL